MKGFTRGKGKSKKFIPTSRKKSGLKKSDLNVRHEDSIPFSAITDFAKMKVENKIINAGNTVNNPLFKEAVKESAKQSGKSAFGFLKTGITKANEKRKEVKEKKKEIVEDIKDIEEINERAIDQIIDDRNTTNEQKFRFLQRYAVENNDSLTDKQRNFANNTLRRLETEGNTPSTFIGATTKGSSSSSSKKKTPDIKPIKLLSGRFETPDELEDELNKAKKNFPNMIPTTSDDVVTVTKTVFPSNLTDLEAEISAVAG